jgi:hypothetical protein
MLLPRVARLKYRIRFWLLAPVSVASVFVGAVVSIWPSIDVTSVQRAPWPFLLVTGLAVALSVVLSIYSFPIGHGERAS